MSHYGSENPYYGGAGGGGGGYMTNGSPYGSQDSPGGKKKANTSTIRPVTVKQVLAADQPHPDSDFAIDGHDVGQVLLVGSVHNSSQSATNVSYEIGDGTGYIDVRLWLDSADDDAQKTKGIQQDKYVSILGTIKVFGGKRHVSATHIRLIEDLDEVYNHLLKALHVSLVLRQGSGTLGAAGKQNDYGAPTTTTTADMSAYATLPPLQAQIMHIVAGEESEDGIHVSAVMEAIEVLMSDGLIFSTIDDLHIKAT